MVGTVGDETIRLGCEGSGGDEELYATSLPGDFRLPGRVRKVSSPTPKARPVTARPTVPHAAN
jgi:hypothetical protein